MVRGPEIIRHNGTRRNSGFEFFGFFEQQRREFPFLKSRYMRPGTPAPTPGWDPGEKWDGGFANIDGWTAGLP